MTRSLKLLPALLLAAGLGCLKPSPPVTYHTLQPLQPEETPAPRGGIAVEVLPVRLPELLQRPQMVLALGSGALELSETQRWGNPLDQDMRRVLVADLGLLLGSDAVVASPYGDRVGASYRVEVEVLSCDARPGALTLEATWMLTRPGSGQAILLRRTVLREPLPGPGPEALATAHSRILAALGREIAAALLKRP
jgi:hypothetical protein